MTNSTFQPVWSLLSRYTFDYKTDYAECDLICVICHKLVMDAVVSGVCGCQYCYNCVHDYTSDGDKHCPGGKEYCKDDFVLLDRNATRNMLINRKISKLKLKCPNQSCLCDVELIEMEEHLRFCDKRTINCPYGAIGCESEPARKESILSHLHNDTLPHTELLIDLIKIMQNEINVLRENFANSKLEIVFLKDELATVKNKINTRVSDETKEMKVNIYRLRREVNDLKDRLENGLKKYKSEIEFLKDESRKNKDIIDSLNEELRRIQNEFQMTKKKEKNNGKVESIAIEVHESENAFSTIKELKPETINKADIEYQNIVVEFIWNVECCSKNIDKYLWSEPFYGNSYKMCVFMFIGSQSDDIELFCYIMKGVDDDKLPWPLKCEVTLSIMEPVMHRTYISETFISEFKRPDSYRGNCVGRGLVKYSVIKDQPIIHVDDSILVSCVVNHL